MRAFAKLKLIGTGSRKHAGAVLLEVVLALVLFVAAATIIGSALNSSANGVERIRLGVHAANLATSVLSEIQIGSRATGDGTPEPFAPPFEAWMWQVQTLALDEQKESAIGSPEPAPAGLVQVEVVVRDTDSDFTYRLSQVMPLSSIQSPDASGIRPGSVASASRTNADPW
jgi:hypothetical protein